MGTRSEIYHLRYSVVVLFILIGFLWTTILPANAQSQDSSKTLQDLQNQYQGQPVQVNNSSDKIDLALYKSRDGVAVGSTFELLILLTIEDGWHINAHKPIQSYLIGTSFKLTEQQNFELQQNRYPEASLLKFGFSDDTLKVYEEKTPVFVTLRAPAKLRPGTYTISGSLAVQACNNSVCLKPSTLPVSIEIEVLNSEKAPKMINQDLFEKYLF